MKKILYKEHELETKTQRNRKQSKQYYHAQNHTKSDISKIAKTIDSNASIHRNMRQKLDPQTPNRNEEDPNSSGQKNTLEDYWQEVRKGPSTLEHYIMIQK